MKLATGTTKKTIAMEMLDPKMMKYKESLPHYILLAEDADAPPAPPTKYAAHDSQAIVEGIME
jgi:hypothetical protein